MKQTDIPAQVAIESRALEIAQRLDDELLGATLPQSAAYESLTRLLEGAADTLRELVVFRRAAPPSGDRSLLRAPTPSEFMKARARQLVMIARENAWTDEQLAGQILDEVYAVDGLRGTEDRALREQLEALAEAAQNYLLAEQHVGVSEEQMRALHHRLGSLAGPHLKAKCEVPSRGEGGTHGGD